jgi:hypothetical protein
VAVLVSSCGAFVRPVVLKLIVQAWCRHRFGSILECNAEGSMALEFNRCSVWAHVVV